VTPNATRLVVILLKSIIGVADRARRIGLFFCHFGDVDDADGTWRGLSFSSARGWKPGASHVLTFVAARKGRGKMAGFKPPAI